MSARNDLIVAFLVLCLATDAHSARPMITDDARLTDAHACQVETWRRANRGSREFWALPACNPTGNLELTLGGNDLPDGAGGRNNDVVLQGKTLFRPLATNDYGIGLAVGTFVHTTPEAGQRTLGTLYGYVPMSRSWFDDHVVVHLNLGGQDNRDTAVRSLTWGLGTELNFTPRFALIAESFGDNHTRHSYQGGIRFWVIPGRWQIDTTMGAQSGNIGATRWWSIGIRLISPPFLK